MNEMNNQPNPPESFENGMRVRAVEALRTEGPTSPDFLAWYEAGNETADRQGSNIAKLEWEIEKALVYGESGRIEDALAELENVFEATRTVGWTSQNPDAPLPLAHLHERVLGEIERFQKLLA